MSNNRVIITGGAGYIGSHTCKHLHEKGYDILIYDNLSTGHADFLQWGDFIHGDILDTATLVEAINKFKPAGIIHFASFINVGESTAHPGKYYKNNVCGSLSILEAMRLTGVNKLVASSSAAVYGNAETVPIDEASPIAPLNPYGTSKAMMEQLMADYTRSYGFNTAALRYFNAAGNDPELKTGERHEPETHLIPKALLALSGKEPCLKVFGNDYPTPDGTCVRDYIHVNDLACAHRLAFEKLCSGTDKINCNLGTGSGFSVLEIIEKIQKITGKPVPCEVTGRRAGDPATLVAKTGLAKTLLGWEACHSSLENIIATAWSWFKQEH